MRLPRVNLQIAPGFGERVPVDLQIGRGGRRTRHAAAREIARARNRQRSQSIPAKRAIRLRNQQARRRSCRAGWRRTCPIRPARCRRPALRLSRCCGRIAYLTGPNSVECSPIRNERREQQRQMLGSRNPASADHHDADLEELDVADDARFVVFVGELAGRRRKQEERQDEETAR